MSAPTLETTHCAWYFNCAAVPSASAVKPGTVNATLTWQPAACSAPICGATFVFVGV